MAEERASGIGEVGRVVLRRLPRPGRWSDRQEFRGRGFVMGVTLATLSLTCQSPPPDDPAGDVGTFDVGGVSFSKDIQPLLTMCCVDCHSPGGEAEIQGIPQDLREGNAYAAIVNQSSAQDEAWTLVVPSNPESSLLYLKVSSDEPPVGVRMPNDRDPLPDDQIDLIRRWISEGAENN